jgi:hypothetical protein
MDARTISTDADVDAAVAMDIEGAARTLPYDIGAYESGAAPAPDPTCNDGIQNGDETGVDCGGSCDPCAVSATGSGALISRRRAY